MQVQSAAGGLSPLRKLVMLSMAGFFFFEGLRMSFKVYVLESKEGYRYTGMTDSLERRLREHNEHSLSFWTKRGTGWKLVYSEEFASKSEALRHEKWLKSGAGRDYLKEIP